MVLALYHSSMPQICCSLMKFVFFEAMVMKKKGNFFQKVLLHGRHFMISSLSVWQNLVSQQQVTQLSWPWEVNSFFSRKSDSTTTNVHQGCGYIESRMWLYSKRCGYIAQNPHLFEYNHISASNHIFLKMPYLLFPHP